MIPVKTAAGQQVLKDRSLKLTPRQRTALILIDGKRSFTQVLHDTQAAGIARDDIDRLFELALVAANDAGPLAQEPPVELVQELSPQQRYAAAYPIASQLTASLGLRGFRLNLAVEAATNHEQLVAVAARIREAVGSEKFAPLQAALGQAG